ncbi:MAG: BTAD domain-containing putative transcriptional regulator, partial [Anaerolineae bacterium]
MMETLHIQLLGDFSLCYGDTIVTTVQSPQEQSLLAYLLLHREAPQSRQHISFLFWPDATEAQARRQLRKILFRLRRDLPQADDFLQVDTQTIQWRPDTLFVLDVASFEDGMVLAEQLIASGSRSEALLALDEALALYKGDLLPVCYDDWISPERERLSQSFVRALEEATTLLEMQREYTRAIDVAQRLLLHDPLHEPSYRSLMRLQALVGNRATALRVYHTCVTTLQRELGVEPDADTRQVYERLLRTGIQTRSASVLPLPVLIISQPLVGRHQEWQQLLSIWQHAIGGVSQLVMMAGVAGIGKTRLAEELARWVKRQGHVVLTAHCYAAEGELAYGPVVQWLRARPLPPLEAVWRRELARLLPELASDLPGAAPPGPITEAWQRQRLFEALARAVRSGKSPLLLILDDVQWCDQETLVWLHYLLHFSAAAPVLILATLRLEEVGVNHPLSEWMRSAQRVAPVHEITLGPLTETETLSLAEKVAGQMLEADLAACILSETEGNPLFVLEMVRAGKVGDAQDLACPLQGLPAKVQATIEGRLALISPSARALAGLAAVVGREFTFDVLARASEFERDVTLAALDELWQRRIVREQGGAGYDFTHDKLRQVAYASLTEAHRRALHRKVAVALEMAYGAGLAA